jgi:dihydrodiol dehydrogenase / D-xylose 1-dehydrogenase (NADP)
MTSFVHTIAAAASSSGVFRAQEFLRAVGAPLTAKPYGSYEEFGHRL